MHRAACPTSTRVRRNVPVLMSVPVLGEFCGFQQRPGFGFRGFGFGDRVAGLLFSGEESVQDRHQVPGERLQPLLGVGQLLLLAGENYFQTPYLVNGLKDIFDAKPPLPRRHGWLLLKSVP